MCGVNTVSFVRVLIVLEQRGRRLAVSLASFANTVRELKLLSVLLRLWLLLANRLKLTHAFIINHRLGHTHSFQFVVAFRKLSPTSRQIIN